MAEHFCVKLGDPSCSGFEISCEKTGGRTDIRTPLQTLRALRLPLSWVISLTVDALSR